jgi:hypothetical protein
VGGSHNGRGIILRTTDGGTFKAVPWSSGTIPGRFPVNFNQLTAAVEEPPQSPKETPGWISWVLFF